MLRCYGARCLWQTPQQASASLWHLLGTLSQPVGCCYSTEAGSGSSGSDSTPDASVADDFQRRLADLAQAPDASATFARLRSTAAAPTAAAPAAATGVAPSIGSYGSIPDVATTTTTSSSSSSFRGSNLSSSGEAARAGSSATAAAAGSTTGSSKTGPHPQYGYAVLGGINPETADQEAGAQQPKLHPRKNFKPGDTYDPDDLNPFGAGQEGGFLIPMRRPGAPPPYRISVSMDEAREGVDFRNTALLRHFVSDSGRLRPRRETKLPRSLQRRVAKAVKLSRQMALMPFEMVVGDAEPDARSRMLEYEAARNSYRLRRGMKGR